MMSQSVIASRSISVLPAWPRHEYGHLKIPTNLTEPALQTAKFLLLPVELVLQIIDELDLVSKIALLITCKRLFYLSPSVRTAIFAPLGNYRRERRQLLRCLGPSPLMVGKFKMKFDLCHRCLFFKPAFGSFWDDRKPLNASQEAWDNAVAGFCAAGRKQCPQCRWRKVCEYRRMAWPGLRPLVGFGRTDRLLTLPWDVDVDEFGLEE